MCVFVFRKCHVYAKEVPFFVDAPLMHPGIIGRGLLQIQPMRSMLNHDDYCRVFSFGKKMQVVSRIYRGHVDGQQRLMMRQKHRRTTQVVLRHGLDGLTV